MQYSMAKLARGLVLSLSVVMLFGLHQQVEAHSWMVCADYPDVPTETSVSSNWEPEKCKAYVRGYSRSAQFSGPNIFTSPSGYTNRPGSPCGATITREEGESLESLNDGKWGRMANFSIGGSYMAMWSSQNHAKVRDTTFKVFAVCGNTKDPTLQEFLDPKNLVVDWKATTEKGFGNCPAVHAAQPPPTASAESQCYQYLNITESFFSKYVGKQCTFLWYWEFNPGELYSTCFDANILAAAASKPGGSGSGSGAGGGNQGSSKPGSGGSNAGAAVGAVFAIFACIGVVGFVLYKKKPELFQRGGTTTGSIQV